MQCSGERGYRLQSRDGFGAGNWAYEMEPFQVEPVANGEFMIATAVIGASNALRERAWADRVDAYPCRS
jgi:hypothetical protein